MEQSPHRLVLVTGSSGAGRSSALKVLEDIGFETIDNIPMGWVPRLLSGARLERPMALCLDTRNRDFSTRAFLELLDQLQELDPELLYLDGTREVLQRRFSETRRRHPMAQKESAVVGIDREKDLLSAIRDRADMLVDTSEMSVHDLRAAIELHFAPAGKMPLALTLMSFSYKRGLPQGADIVHDCRFLMNPYWNENLRAYDGRNEAVAAFITEDARFATFFQQVREATLFLLPAYQAEGKTHLCVAFGCTGGQHRSVFVTEKLAGALAQQGWQVSIRHRELDRRDAVSSKPTKARSGEAKE